MNLIASDFDGTVYIDDRYRSEDLLAIEDFQQKGNLFGLVTGRSYKSLTDLIEGKIWPDFIIANNGSHIFVRNGKEMTELLKFTLDKDKLGRLIDFYRPYFPIKIISDKDRNLKKLSELESDEGVLALAIYSDDFLDNPFDDDFSFHKSVGVIDVINKEVSKQTGIEFIKEFYGYDREIIAIGDDFNDISFLKETKLSYTLTYVREKEVLDVCNYRVEGVKELIDIYSK